MTKLQDMTRKLLAAGGDRQAGGGSESAALVVGTGALTVGFLIALPTFFGRELTISGDGSVGNFAAHGGAIVAALAFLLGRYFAKRRTDPAEIAARVPDPSRPRLHWYDTFAIALAHAAIADLGWLGLARLLEQSFIGAPVYPLPGAILVSVAFALTAYMGFLSGKSMTPMLLSLVLAVFLVIGALTAMLRSSDPKWWQENLSALGMASNTAAPTFNLTLIIAGIMVATVTNYATAGLPVDTEKARRARAVVRTALILMGVFLACVGIFPVDRFLPLHNTVATGMAVVYAIVVIGLPWLVPTMPRVFVLFGWAYVVIIILLAIFFAVGYYNLTAVELVAAILIFSWVIVFLRIAEPQRAEAETRGSAN